MNIFAVIMTVFTFVLLCTGMPLAIAFAFGSLIIILTIMGIPLEGIAGFAFNSVNSFPLLACPFFILAGNLLVRSGGMEHVRDFMQSWFGQMRGGLAVGAIIIAAFIGAVSGSTAAGLAIMGTIVLPIMVEAGYSRPFSATIALTGGELSWLIPPSLGFVLFGALNRVSIADLFLSGIGPSILSAAFMIVVAVWISRRRNYPTAPRVGWRERGNSFVQGLPLLFMPIVVLGGIYGGIFSPTESAAVGCLYTLLIGTLFYRKLNWAGIKESLLETLKISCMIYFIIVCADLFCKMISFIKLPDAITTLVLGLELGPVAFLIVVQVFLLALGFFFSSLPMIIIILPLFMPAVHNLGIDPVYFGAVSMMSVCIGEITPPMGPQLWFAEPICKVKMGDIMRESWIFLLAMTVPIFIVIFVPQIAMFLVNLFK